MEHKKQKIIFLITDDFQPLDLFGPLEAFSTAKAVSFCDYEWAVASFSLEPVMSESGIKIMPDIRLCDVRDCDTLVLCGGQGARTTDLEKNQITLLRQVSEKCSRIVSICTGAFIMSQIGLTEGRRVATHWRYSDELAEHYPTAQVDPDALFVKDGKFWSSAGVTAGIDLALALIAEDYGNAISAAVARQLVVYMRRTGDQAQFSEPLFAQSNTSERLAPLLEWMTNNLSKPLSVQDLAERANISPRQFSRIFQKNLKLSPARYVEYLRLDKARLMLLQEKSRIDEVAKAVGFSNPDSFRRAFERRFSVAPTLYQKQFGYGIEANTPNDRKSL